MTTSTVNLILGPARSGKTERALVRYCAALDLWHEDPCGPPQVWIGPTPSALNDIRDRLAERAKGGWLNPRVSTFATLAQEIVSQGSRRVRPICALEKLRVLSHVIQSLVARKQLKHFGAVASTPGFVRQVAAAIADLKRRDVWADEVAARSRTPRDRDFALIYSAYQTHLGEHQLFDTEGRFWAAREELESNLAAIGHSTAEDWRYGMVVLDGFADFTAAQHDLLRLLGRQCQELLITLPADNGPRSRDLLFDKPQRTLAQLKASFPELRCEMASEPQFFSAGLKAMERNIFRDDAIASTSAEGLSIVAANGVQGEIREVARRVKQLLLEGTAKPEDIGVVFPSARDVASRVVEVFDDFGLPLALDDRPRLSSLPLVRCLARLLRLAVEDWPFELLLDVVGNVNIQLTDVMKCVAVEHCIRRAQLPAGRVLLLEQLQEWADSATPNENPDHPDSRLRLAREAELALQVLGGLDSALAGFNARRTLWEWVGTLEVTLNRLAVMTAENDATWQLLKTQFKLILKIDQDFAAADHKLDAAGILELLERVAVETFVPQSTDPVGRVRVVSAEQARNLSVKHLFLAGLTEQSYSSAEGTGSLYREAEIQRFTDSGPGKDSALQQTGEAMLLFYDMVTRADESLTLSYPAIDDKGQALTPSPYLTELERCFTSGSISISPIPAAGDMDLSALPRSRSDWRHQAMLMALEGKHQWLAGLAGSGNTRQVGRAILRGVESVAARGKREAFGPYEGLLLGTAASGLIASRFGPDHLWSAGQLEKYAACPYKFFACQILRLEPLDDLALRSDHLRKGQLLHQIMAAIHTQSDTSASLDAKQLVERFTALLEQFIHDTPLKGIDEALREIERREILSWAPQYSQQEVAYRERWSQFDEPLVPVHFEMRFGPKPRAGNSASDAVSVDLPFTLDLGKEQIKLTGQIDRIDMGRVAGVTVFNIIDYKSGKEVKLADAEIAAGRQLQLPLYALAAEKLLFADRKAVALATGYWSIKSGGFAQGRDSLLEFRIPADGGLADSPRWSALNTSIVRRVGEIVRGVRAGHFPIYSEIVNCTVGCEYSRICRIAQIRSLEKEWIADSQVNGSAAEKTNRSPSQPQN